MEASIKAEHGFLVVEVAGAVDRAAAGELYDVLVNWAVDRDARMIVDLAGVPVLSHAGARGLVVAARLLRQARGDMRICGANDKVAAVLQSIGFDHLLKLEPTRAAAMAAMSFHAPKTPFVPRAVEDRPVRDPNDAARRPRDAGASPTWFAA